MSPHRRLVMWNQVSADGYFADVAGGLGWVVPDREMDRAVAAGIDSAGTEPGRRTVLFGRRTYEQFAAFWPHVRPDTPTTDPHSGRPLTPEMRAMAAMLNAATKLVFSRSVEAVDWDHAQLRRAIDPEEIAALKAQPGSDIMVFGSGSVVSELTRLRLVDEYQLVVQPVLLGAGRSLLTGLDQPTRVELVEATPYPSGKVLLRYVPVR